jgi:hypothetical protein
MDHAVLPLGSGCLQRRLIRKFARSVSTSINSNNLNLRYWFSLNTPKALANFSPGFELARTLGTITLKGVLTLQGFANHLTLSGFSV